MIFFQKEDRECDGSLLWYAVRQLLEANLRYSARPYTASCRSVDWRSWNHPAFAALQGWYASIEQTRWFTRWFGEGEWVISPIAATHNIFVASWIPASLPDMSTGLSNPCCFQSRSTESSQLSLAFLRFVHSLHFRPLSWRETAAAWGWTGWTIYTPTITTNLCTSPSPSASEALQHHGDSEAMVWFSNHLLLLVLAVLAVLSSFIIVFHPLSSSSSSTSILAYDLLVLVSADQSDPSQVSGSRLAADDQLQAWERCLCRG